MATYLVTGAAGFIGSNLCDSLLQSGNTVIAVDNFHDYYEKSIKEKNIVHNVSNKNYIFVEGDVSKTDFVKKILDEHKIDGIFHLAAVAGVRASIENPKRYFDVNLSGLLGVLNAIRGTNVRLVVASSSSVYGNSENLPLREELPTSPISPYGWSKVLCEKLCESFSQTYGLKIVLLRYFTVYGPRQRPDMALNKFLTAAMKNEPITIFGDGKQTRDFTFVEDIVSGTIAAMESDAEGVFNIGGGNRISVNDLVKVIEEVSGLPVKVSYIEKQAGDVSDTLADYSKAQKNFNFKPRTDIRTGVRAEFDWLKKSVNF